MSLQVYVQQRQADGKASAREIHAEIVAPSKVVTAGTEARPTAALESSLRNLLVPDILSANAWSNANPANRADVIDQRFETRMGVANLSDPEWVALARIRSRYELLRSRIERQGGDATGPLSGVAERETSAVSEGPALWQTWGIERPTVKQVREVMQ